MEPASYRAYFPVVSSGDSLYYFLAGIVTIVAAFFPLASWLSVLLAPLVLLTSPFWVSTGSLMNALGLVIIIPVYFFFMFMAIFGEIILIPWAMLSLPMIGVGVTLFIISFFT